MYLADRRHGTDVVAEVDQGVKKMEAYVKALELEIAEREKLIEILHQATLFYESQRGEAKIVSNVSICKISIHNFNKSDFVLIRIYVFRLIEILEIK